MRQYNKKRVSLLLILLISLLLIGVFGVWPEKSPFEKLIHLIEIYYRPIQQFVAEYHIESMLIYFSISSLSVALCMPGFAAIGLIGGSLFPFYQALICALFGLITGTMTLRAYLPTLLMKLGAKRWLNHHYVIQARSALTKSPFLYLLTARLIPILPFTVVNLISCLLKAPFRPLFLATSLGMMPRITIYILVGSQLNTLLLSGKDWHYQDLLSFNMILSLWFIALLTLLPALVQHQVKRRENKKNHSIR